jgi:DNA (cytosine-5)-methyltransferase 1
MTHRPIPIIDLFAGPGGLGEGFSQVRSKNGQSKAFQIALSVEMDPEAHKTLRMRSFFRQLQSSGSTEDYYKYLCGKLEPDSLFDRHSTEAKIATHEAQKLELGKDNNEIHARIHVALQELGTNDWVLIGGPPCQAYSTVGRSRMRTAIPEKFENDPRHTLYLEYLNIIAEFHPTIFVMENVRGILSSRYQGELIFPRILADLREPGRALEKHNECPSYRVYSLAVESGNPDELKPADFVIHCEKYGIPQTRHRVILLGVRSDRHVQPRPLVPAPMHLTAGHVLHGLPPLRSALSKHPEARACEWGSYIKDLGESQWFDDMAEEAFRTGDQSQQELIRKINMSLKKLKINADGGKEFIPGDFPLKPLSKTVIMRSKMDVQEWYRDLQEWYYDPHLGGVCNHTARTHMPADLHRYLFAACFAKVYRQSPIMREFPAELLPKHSSARKQVQSGDNDEMFEDRFRVQVENRPATTITSHIHKDGHYHIHFDPTQCRSLTVREAARLQTFPDNYKFEGPRTQQYKQVGNAVPPLLARQIGAIVYELIGPGSSQDSALEAQTELAHL